MAAFANGVANTRVESNAVNQYIQRLRACFLENARVNKIPPLGHRTPLSRIAPSGSSPLPSAEVRGRPSVWLGSVTGWCLPQVRARSGSNPSARKRRHWVSNCLGVMPSAGASLEEGSRPCHSAQSSLSEIMLAPFARAGDGNSPALAIAVGGFQ